MLASEFKFNLIYLIYLKIAVLFKCKVSLFNSLKKCSKFEGFLIFERFQKLQNELN